MLFFWIAYLISQFALIQSTNNYTCGYQGTFNKILGGRTTELGEFPWLARLEYLDNNDGNKSAGFRCSGSLIDEQVVLTAAHCINYMQTEQLSLYRVRLGEYDESTKVDCILFMGSMDCAYPHQDIEVLDYVIHPHFFGGYSDIALIFLKTKAVYSEFVQPICLPASNTRIRKGQNCYVSGWGTPSGVKLKTEIPITDYRSCSIKYYLYENIRLSRLRHICAGGLINRDTYKGDSGTPLMVPTKGGEIWAVLGIASIGKDCGTSYWPGVYTNVAFYVDWIKNEIIRLKSVHELL